MKQSERFLAVAVARGIAQSIAVAKGYTYDDVIRQCRRPDLCRLRWEIWSEAKAKTGLGRETLAKAFARDKLTILHGLRRHQELSRGA